MGSPSCGCAADPEKAAVAPGGDGDNRAVTPFGELAAVGRDQQRKMRELGRLEAGGAEDQDVLEGVGEMVLPANDVADAEIDIVGAGSEMVSGSAAASEKSEVFDIVGGLDLFAINRVVKADLSARAPRNAEPQSKSPPGRRPAVAFGARHFAHPFVEEPRLTSA